MIKMELKTNDKKTYIMSELFEQYIFIKNQPVRVNEIEYNILISNVKKRKKYSKEYDISEESISYPSTYQNSVYKYQGMSQIDKFNEKYNVDKQVQKVKK